ncbi:unnamed protein product [Paramecium pentaurelia]|uniref:Uncharacterized protein n=1 Tax=Paramecium pentaurelia TaxID=43138 RepID=A0A8S1WKE7_9CILI|nr:unnamed protein product [Paramecium pentaurelia]
MGIACSNCQNIIRGIQYHQQQVQQIDNNHKLEIKQVLDCEAWSFYRLSWFKKIVQIVTLTNENERRYFFDGELLRMQIFLYLKKQRIKTQQCVEFLNFPNLEQLIHLNWSGKYGQQNQKVGKWITTWKGEILRDTGGWYSKEEKKQGFWIDLSKNYRKKAEVYESGYYIDDQRYGIWNYIYDDQFMIAGHYNYQGQKSGKWTELSDRYCYFSKVKYNDEYKNGKKVGLWDIWFEQEYRYDNKLIGGGSYDGDGNKIGKWIELSEGFQDDSQITYIGHYRNCKKIGRWDIWFKTREANFLTGGGSYDEDGNKIGKWIELSDGFQEQSQTTYIGQYRNGNKIGRWDICQLGEIIGGGQYDEVDSIKIGRWIEPSDFFLHIRQIIYIGEYKNGKKINRWDIEKRREKGEPFYKIGGGSYDLEQGSIKVGKWFEFNDHYHQHEFVTSNGEYKNGNKIGKWVTFWTREYNLVHKQIACGFYDELSFNKFGKWIELNDTFSYSSQVTNIGKYKNGIKVGRWDIYFQLNFQDEKNLLIGGGSYDEEQGFIKVGKWIELGSSFDSESQVTYIGEYRSGKRVGKWDIWFDQFYDKIKQVGGGFYDEEQGYIKVGKWIELSDNFKRTSQVTFEGEYKNSRKIGRWEIWYNEWYKDKKNVLLGGGQYKEEKGFIKCGFWIDVCDSFEDFQQCVLIGEYKNNRKVGIWIINCKSYGDFYGYEREIIFEK